MQHTYNIMQLIMLCSIYCLYICIYIHIYIFFGRVKIMAMEDMKSRPARELCFSLTNMPNYYAESGKEYNISPKTAPILGRV